MLPKDSRVRTRADIEMVMRKGRSITSPFFAFRILRPGGADRVRFGFIVSNKISKKAVIRNRIKRRLRETARLFSSRFPSQSDVIVVARSALVNADTALIREQFEIILKRLGL